MLQHGLAKLSRRAFGLRRWWEPADDLLKDSLNYRRQGNSVHWLRFSTRSLDCAVAPLTAAAVAAVWAVTASDRSQTEQPH